MNLHYLYYRQQFEFAREDEKKTGRAATGNGPERDAPKANSTMAVAITTREVGED